MKIGLFLIGKKGLISLKYLVDNLKNQIVCYVVGSKDSAIEKDYYDEIYTLCLLNNIKFFERTIFHDKLLDDIDIIFTIGWRWLIKDTQKKLIVFHDSLLPKLRGFNPLVTTLIEGQKFMGVTAIIANNKVDAGNIIGQSSQIINYPIKIEDAINQISEIYSKLLFQVISDCSNNNLIEILQDENEVTYSLWRDDEDYNIDWNMDSNKIKRFIDAVGFPYNCASSFYDLKKIRIIDASVVQDFNIINRSSGKIFQIIDNLPIVVCGSGLLKIEKAFYQDSTEEVKFNNLRRRLS